ncbi:MAG: hypothetical protein AAF299_15300 [Pseudomonadota bacterium]
MRVAGHVVFVGAAVFLVAVTADTTLTAQINPGSELRKAPQEGGPRRWKIVGGDITLKSAPSPDADDVGAFANAAIVNNLGCMEVADQVWCKVRPFRGGTAGFARAAQLQPAQGPDGVMPMGVDDSRRRARVRDFDSKGKVACAQEHGQAMGTCLAGVARSGGGDATVVVTFPNGFARNLYFVHGEFVRASATMSGVGTDMDWRLQNRRYFIRVDDQRYELPTTLIFEN